MPENIFGNQEKLSDKKLWTVKTNPWLPYLNFDQKTST